MTYQTSALRPQDEQLWFTQMRDDSPYGTYQYGEDHWLMLQPTLFYNQRKRLTNGQLVLGRIEQSRDHTVLSLSHIKGIESLGISRIHATLLPMEYGVAVQDVGSTNGSRLNGLPLIAGRSYNLNHGDILELGRLSLHVHVIEMDIFLRGIRNLILNRFTPEVQDVLFGMVAPTETLMLLLQRLPNRESDQLQVISVFKERNEPLTLEKLHERINKVLGTNPDLKQQFTDLSGDVTMVKEMKKPAPGIVETTRLGDKDETVEQLAQKVEGENEAEVSATEKIEIKSTRPLGSAAYIEWCKSLYGTGSDMVKQLEDYMARAEKLDSFTEREMARNLVMAMLMQMNVWLPTVKEDIPRE